MTHEKTIKHTYTVVMDGEVIATHIDKVSIHPVYAITLMGEELSEKMQETNKDYWSDALDEVKKNVRGSNRRIE